MRWAALLLAGLLAGWWGALALPEAARAAGPRQQRRRCRSRGCRGRNWCPDMDVGNRAFLAPTVFEGKARSMSSLRKPGSNYAVTFEVRQVYKSQPGFLPLQKNDSVRLHFRDKTVPGKSTLCAPEDRDTLSAGVVRANIKRDKVYLVFVNRVGPRNFTILGEPVIRSKKKEQAVQAVIRPDYGESQRTPGRPGPAAVPIGARATLPFESAGARPRARNSPSRTATRARDPAGAPARPEFSRRPGGN